MIQYNISYVYIIKKSYDSLKNVKLMIEQIAKVIKKYKREFINIRSDALPPRVKKY